MRLHFFLPILSMKKPVVGVISSLPMGAGFDPQTRQVRQPPAIVSQLEQLFEVRQLTPAAVKTIDKDIGVLALVHPKNLSDDAQYAIDQFVLRGGHLLVFVDPLAESDEAGADPQNPQAAMMADKSSDLQRLFKAWGVEYDAKKVVLDVQHALQISLVQGAPPVRHAAILGFTKRDLNPTDITTATLQSINVSSAGYFQLAKDAKNKLTPLIQTSADAMTVPSERVKFSPTLARLAASRANFWSATSPTATSRSWSRAASKASSRRHFPNARAKVMSPKPKVAAKSSSLPIPTC